MASSHWGEGLDRAGRSASDCASVLPSRLSCAAGRYTEELAALPSARPGGREDNYLRQQSEPVYLGEHLRCQNKAALSSDSSHFQQRAETSN